jgi:3'(2'), 5'-bisphosphate nucleotidase
MSSVTPEDHLAAAEIATAAGELLLETRRQLFADGADQWTVKDEGDMRAHHFIVDALHDRFPDDAVLSEEGRDDPVRLTRDRVWIVDPLDGTREFSEGRHDWAVHVALSLDHRPVAAAVALPALGETLTTEPPAAIAPLGEGPPRMIVSRSRPPAAAMIVAAAIGARLVEAGSAGYKAMAVLRGEADLYAHSGGQYEWDSCAPVAVAVAAGLHASRCDGSEMLYNQRDVWLPDLLVCRPELAEAALDALGRAIRGEIG